MPTRPILACKVDDIIKLSYPLLASPKIDGVRALRLNNTLLSRSFKEIPNTYVRNYLTANAPDGFDGELIVLGDSSSGESFHVTQSGIMSEQGIPLFAYLVFDYCPHGFEHLPYESRLSLLTGLKASGLVEEIRLVTATLIQDPDHLTQYEETCLKEGYEGVCLRLPNSPYKSGRSTLRESYLLKLKRFVDAEAKIVGVQELERNGNCPELSELGLLKRSSKAEGKTRGETLGALVVEDCSTGQQFNIGTGFTSDQRQEFWNNRDRLLGQLVTYKSQPYGAKDKPRIPVFKGFRSVLDL